MKPKVAVFAFTSCEGCSLVILSLEEIMLDLLGAVEFVNFREAIDERRDDYDIAIIDGAISQKHEIAELKELRERAKVVVAMGACAVQGGLYALRNSFATGYPAKYVYGSHAGEYGVLPVTPLSAHVKVDHNLYGCPIDKGEFVELVRSLLAGRRPFVPDYPVCNECRTGENICVFELGKTCMGPVTRAGCGAICPAHGSGCCACRGTVGEPCLESHRHIMESHGVSPEETLERLRLFNSLREGRYG